MLIELKILQKSGLRKLFGLGVFLASCLAINQNVIVAQEMHASNTSPVYPGGNKALQEFISNNLKYPDEAQKAGVSGTVEVKFMINTQGKVENTKVMKGLSKECDAEAVRLTGLINGWSPGTRQGKPVKTFVCLPVEFKGEKKLRPAIITGTVVEKTTDIPLEGILIIIKDTNIGSVTGPDGSYRLEVPSEADYLEYFGVGYSTQVLKIDYHSTINIELDPEYLIVDLQDPGK